MKNDLIKITGLRKSYGKNEVLKGIDINIKEEEVVVVIGPSGGGKSTFLRCINYLEVPTGGEIVFDGIPLNGEANINEVRKEIGMVFQRFNLFPHMTVMENLILAPMKVRHASREEAMEKAEMYLKKVGLLDKAAAYPDSLSGGQQQRVAIARALVNEPEVLLLDEPLGALDLKLRKEMQIELKRMQKKLGITFIFVTHDQEEALTMSDTIAVMNHGIIQQIGCPTDVYNEPKNRFVARFIGESNIFEATMRRDYLVNIHGIDYECVDAGFGTEQPVDVVIRPEDVDFVPIGKTPLHGVVTSVLFMGVHYEFTVDCDGRIFKVHSTDFVPVGETVGIEVLPDAIHIMNPERKQPTEAAAEEPQQNL